MPLQRDPELGRRAVTLLATAFVVFIGAVLTAFTVLSAAEHAGWQAWAVWAFLFGSVIWMLWCLVEQPDQRPSLLQQFWSRARRRVDPLTLYKPRRRRFNPETPWGSNQPPTLESLREAAQESSNTWVPHSVPDRERKKR
jgi:hypothetical protein